MNEGQQNKESTIIGTSVRSIQDSCSRLEGFLGKLKNKLVPALGPEIPTKAEDESQKRSSCSPLADELYVINDHLLHMSDELDTIITRLEI